jgi:hypothetical protein
VCSPYLIIRFAKKVLLKYKCYYLYKACYHMETDKPQPTKKSEFKEREVTRLFEGIEDEINLITASAKFSHTTCKMDEKSLKLVLAYIDDTKKLTGLLKNRISLLMENTS